MENYLEGVIDRFENNIAVLLLTNGQSLNWPKEKLPTELKEGAAVKIFMTTDKGQTANQEQAAKDLLNEILK